MTELLPKYFAKVLPNHAFSAKTEVDSAKICAFLSVTNEIINNTPFNMNEISVVCIL